MRTNRKTIIALLLTLFLTFLLSSCRKSAPPPDTQPSSQPTVSAKQGVDAPDSLAPQKAAAPEPGSYEGLIARAEKASAGGDYAYAANYYARAGQLRKDDLPALRGQADALVKGEYFEQAVPVYRRIVELEPNDPLARFNLAVTLSRLRRFDQAEAIYLQLISERDDNLQARYNLASLYQAQGKLAQAKAAWQEVVDRAPQLGSAHAALGEVLLDMDRPEQSMAAYIEATRCEPNKAEYWINLASAACTAGSLGRAGLAAQKAVELAPEDIQAWQLLGNIMLNLYRAGSEKKFLVRAVDAWRHAMELNPNQKEIQQLLDTYEPLVENITTTATAPAN